MHNLASNASAESAPFRSRPALVTELAPVVRRAQLVDVLQLAALVNGFAADQLLLPRSTEQVALALDNYVVAVDAGGRVLACASLDEYSPSIAEVASVAVDRGFQGLGLGAQVGAAAEQIARQRGFEQVFAMSLAERFFSSMGYAVVALADYPEKLARYESLVAGGVAIVPKRCFAKTIAE